MAQIFLSYQKLLMINISNALPEELCECFQYNIKKCGEISRERFLETVTCG